MASSATLLSLSSTICAIQNQHASSSPTTSFLGVPHCRRMLFGKRKSRHRFVVVAVTQESEEEKIPSWAKPDSEEPPPWDRDEAQNNTSSSSSSSQPGFEIPFYVYLLASAITAIAAIGSIFEYVNQRPVFGVISSDSVFYAPLLGFFAFTGIPSSAFLWFKSVQAANKEAEEQDRRDGY